MPIFNYRMHMTPVDLEVEASTESEAYEIAFLKFQKRMSDLGDGSVDALDERAGFSAVVLDQPDPHVRDYYCDDCGPTEVERPDGDWTETPECTDCGQKMSPVPPEVSFWNPK